MQLRSLLRRYARLNTGHFFVWGRRGGVLYSNSLIWSVARSDLCYHFRLAKHSLLVFSINGSHADYAEENGECVVSEWK